MLSFSVNADSVVQCSNLNAAITPTSPATRFDLNAAEIVLDNQNSLMWARCSVGQTWNGQDCEGPVTLFASWSSALKAADSASYADYDDWRLPNSKELVTLIEESCFAPSVNLLVFPSTYSGDYWTSSFSNHYREYSGVYSGDGTVIDFEQGLEKIAHRSGGQEAQNPSAVRLVRDKPKT
jgi:hypothetical protein